MATLLSPATVLDLVERFDRNRDEYRSGRYNEAQVRQDFLNPFFECLDWDAQNKLAFAEACRDVVHEDSLEIGGEPKAPDYCFRVGGARASSQARRRSQRSVARPKPLSLLTASSPRLS